MSLRDDAQFLIEDVNKKSVQLDYNKALFDIYEGDLLTYVLNDLVKQLSKNSFDQIKHRVTPINVLKRMIDKLSKIYAVPPERRLEPELDSAKEFFQYYLDTMKPDVTMGLANEFFNLFKNTCIEPYLYKGKPQLRVIPSDRFCVYSDDAVNPMHVTHWVKFMGMRHGVRIFYLYTSDEFLIVNEENEVQSDMMAAAGNPDGVNIYGRIPMVYVNRSKHQLVPSPDTDTLAMTKLFPILLTDLNFAVMYQAFSIIYGIDVDATNVVQSPNAFWSLKSDPASNQKPEIGSIKPSVDIDQVINLIQVQLAFWMNSKNIRPGTIGALTKDNFASGISKMVDEMDTSEDRQKQVNYFVDAEADLWDLVLNYMHPVWMTDSEWEGPVGLSPIKKVTTQFGEQKAVVDATVTLDDNIKALDAGLRTRRDAVKNVNPGLDEDQVDGYIKEIDEERTAEVEVEPQEEPNGGQEVRPTDDQDTE